MHNDLANERWPSKLLDVWNWLQLKINDCRVQVLMGDFNMSLFRVVPELRERRVMIDLGAWYPWKSLEVEPMSDSCGIFFVNLPGVYTLTKSLRDIHGDNVTGILARGKKVRDSAVADTVKDGDDPTKSETGEDLGDDENEPPDRVGGFDSIEENAGPGMRLETYLPKGKLVRHIQSLAHPKS